jgi:hypothetical protein
MYIPTRRLLEKCLKVVEKTTGDDRFFWVEAVDKFLKRDRQMTRKKRFTTIYLLMTLLEAEHLVDNENFKPKFDNQK